MAEHCQRVASEFDSMAQHCDTLIRENKRVRVFVHVIAVYAWLISFSPSPSPSTSPSASPSPSPSPPLFQYQRERESALAASESAYDASQMLQEQLILVTRDRDLALNKVQG